MIDDFGMMDYFWFWLLHSKCYFLWYEEKMEVDSKVWSVYMICITIYLLIVIFFYLLIVILFLLFNRHFMFWLF